MGVPVRMLPPPCTGQRGEEHHGRQHREGAGARREDRAAGRQDRQPALPGKRTVDTTQNFDVAAGSILA